MTNRIPCCVPFCRRTAPLSKHPDATEVICAKHYRTVPLARRNLHKRMQKKLTAFWEKHSGELLNTDDGAYVNRLTRMDNKLWERIKSKAIEAAGGIG